MVLGIRQLRPRARSVGLQYGDGAPERNGEAGGRGIRSSVAALNLSPRPGDVEGNLQLAERAVCEAKRYEPNLKWVVLPELFTSGYTALASVHRHAEEAEGYSAQRFTALARELGVYIAYGFPESTPGQGGPFAVHDSANLVGPEGVLLTYRKIHLVRESAERKAFVPGVDLPLVEAGGVRVACVICWDLGFPEVVRGAAAGGAELILAPAGWRTPYGRQYDLSCAARALDNAVYVASANQLGEYPDAHFDTPGGVYAPDGARAPELGTGRLTGRSSALEVDLEASRLWKGSYGNPLFYNESALPAAEGHTS
jgi:5-aminopentanamidase